MLINLLKKYGFIQSQADKCINIETFDRLTIFLIIYVNDALVISSCEQISPHNFLFVQFLTHLKPLLKSVCILMDNTGNLNLAPLVFFALVIAAK